MSSSPALARAAAVVQEVAAADVVSDVALAGEVEDLRRLADVAVAAYVARLRLFDARGVSETQELLTTKQWARHHLNVAAGETGYTMRIGKAMAKLPIVEAALLDGTIRMPHAAVIADLAVLLGFDTVAECQHALVDAAAVNDPARFKAALRAKGMAADSKNAKRKARKDQEGRWLDVAATFNGAVSIDGVLDPESGAIVQAAVEAAATPTGVGDTRTAAQRRADALVDICRGLNATVQPNDHTSAEEATPRGHTEPDNDTSRANGSDGCGENAEPTDGVGGEPADDQPRTAPVDAATGNAGLDDAARSAEAADADQVGSTDARSGAVGAAGGSGCRCGGRGARPSLVVVCDFDTLFDVTSGFGELPNGQPVPGDTVRRLACDATITRVVVGPNSQPLDVGRAQRTVTTAQLKVLRIRDGHCRFPGCDAKFEWCDAHHVMWWSNGGTTSVANLIMLCRRHHTAVHEGGWTVHARPDSEFQFTDPAGVVIGDTTAHTTRELATQLIRSEAAHQP